MTKQKLKPYTVKTLKKDLNTLIRQKQIKPNTKIYLSIDSEGNQYNPLTIHKTSLGIDNKQNILILYPTDHNQNLI